VWNRRIWKRLFRHKNSQKNIS